MSVAPTGTDAPLSPTLSRRHAAGAESARGLMFTLLGEFVLTNGKFAWTSAFIEVLGRLGVEEKASRQAVMRTAADGWLRSERVGRRTRWHLTPAAERVLTEGAERIFSFRSVAREWDGRWLLVTARIPEAERSARHHLRTRLSWAGLGSPAPGLWISPHVTRAAAVEHALREAGVIDEARIFIAKYHGGGEVRAMVTQAWDLAGIEGSYLDFLQGFSTSRGADPLVRIIELVHYWRRFPGIDPTLPKEFLPPDWSGGPAAKLFAARHALWLSKATSEWLSLNQP